MTDDADDLLLRLGQGPSVRLGDRHWAVVNSPTGVYIQLSNYCVISPPLFPVGRLRLDLTVQSNEYVCSTPLCSDQQIESSWEDASSRKDVDARSRTCKQVHKVLRVAFPLFWARGTYNSAFLFTT